MFNPNWFLLILFIKVIIALIGLIDGAPIDVVAAPSTAAVEVQRDTPTETATIENVITETPGKFGGDKHEEPEIESDLIAINNDFENEQSSTLPSVDESTKGHESQTEVTTTESPTTKIEEITTNEIAKELIKEDHKEITKSPITTENPQNTTYLYLVENLQATTEKSILTLNESVQMPVDEKESELINSQIVFENPQKTTQQYLAEMNDETTTQISVDSAQIPTEGIVSEIINSQIEAKNPQKNIQQSLTEFKEIIDETTTPPISVDSVNSSTERIISELLNTQIKTENPQENLTEIKEIADETTTQTFVDSVEIPTEAKISEILNSQIESGNPPKTTHQNLAEIQQIADEIATHFVERVQIPTEAKLSEILNFQIDGVNPQNSTNKNVSEILNIVKETPLDTSTESLQIQQEQNTTQNINENPQNFSELSLSTVKSLNEESSLHTTIEPTISETLLNSQNQTDSVFINTQNVNENPQNFYELNLLKVQPISEVSSLYTTIEPEISEIYNSQIKNENPQNSNEQNITEFPQSKEENSSQASIEHIQVPIEQQISEYFNSHIFNVNAQNTTEQNLPKKQETNEISNLTTAIENFNDPQEVKISEIANTQIENENPQNIQTGLSNNEKIFSIQAILDQVDAELVETTKNEEGSANLNSQIDKENFNKNKEERNQEDINTPIPQETNLQEERVNLNTTLYNENPQNFLSNNLTENFNEIEASVTEITAELLNDLKETQNYDSSSTESIFNKSQNTREYDLSKNSSDEKETINQTNTLSKNVQDSSEEFENNQTRMSLSEEISAVINLLNQDEPKESGMEGGSNSQLSIENEQNNTPTEITVKSEENQTQTLENNFNESNAQVNSVNLNAHNVYGNTQNPHLNSFVEEINQNLGISMEEFRKPELSENENLQILNANLQNPTLPETSGDDMLPQINVQVTEESKAPEIKDNFNSQVFNENLQNSEIAAMIAKIEVNGDNSTHTIKKDHPLSYENANIIANISPENSENTETQAVEEKRDLNTKTILNINEKESVESSKLDNSHNFNSQITTENPPNAGVYILMEKNQLPVENVQVTEDPDNHELGDNMNSQLFSENPQMGPVELVRESPTESPLLNENNETMAAINLSETSTKDPLKDETTEEIKDETFAEESLVSSTESDASYENPGFINLTENINMMLDNFQNTNVETDNQMESYKAPNKSTENEASQLAKLQVEDTGDNTSLFYDPNSSEEVEESTQKIKTSTTEETVTNFTENPVEIETYSSTAQPLEASTFTPLQNHQLTPEDNIDVNIQKAFETLTKSFKNTGLLDTNTVESLETTTLSLNTEAGTTEESTETTTNDRSTYVKATTHRQFASLLEETEMNVHKAFETLREWIANGNKLEEATKNPQVQEETTTMRTDDGPTDKDTFTTNEYSTTEKSEETTNVNEDISGLKKLETSPTIAEDNEEINNTTYSPAMTTMAPSHETSFTKSEENASLVQVTELTVSTDKETTTHKDVEQVTGTTEQDRETTTGQEIMETTTLNDFASNTTDEPIFTRINLREDLTGASLTHIDDSSEEIVGEHRDDDKIETILNEQSSKKSDDEYKTSMTMSPDFRKADATTQAVPTNLKDIIQEMVTFIEHEPTTQKQDASQTQTAQTQAAFMEENQQQIESTTETDMSFHSTSDGEEKTATTTTGEAIVTTTTEEPPTTTDDPLTTTELPSTTIVEPLTTTVVPLTTTTTDDLTTTTEEPEIATTTLVVAVEPEARSLPLPPPKLEYLQNEDGVEVFYGYSIVKHN